MTGVRSKVLGLYLCLKPSGTEPLVGSLCWYEPAAAKFPPTRHELADDKRQAGARAVASEARLTALIEKMRRS